MIPLKAYIHLYNFERSFLDVIISETPLETWQRITGNNIKEKLS